jgi:hypothetical protein
MSGAEFGGSVLAPVHVLGPPVLVERTPCMESQPHSPELSPPSLLPRQKKLTAGNPPAASAHADLS